MFIFSYIIFLLLISLGSLIKRAQTPAIKKYTEHKPKTIAFPLLVLKIHPVMRGVNKPPLLPQAFDHPLPVLFISVE